MTHEKMSLKEAYEFTKSRRSIIRPNPGFCYALESLELRLFGKNSIDPNEINPLYKYFK